VKKPNDVSDKKPSESKPSEKQIDKPSDVKLKEDKQAIPTNNQSTSKKEEAKQAVSDVLKSVSLVQG